MPTPDLTRIAQIAISVSDLPRAIAFYRDTLGLAFLFEAPPALAFFDCSGVRLMMSLPEQEGQAAGKQFGSILYYTVPDIQQAASILGARGVAFDKTPHLVARLPQAELWMAFFPDPDGNMLAIMSEIPAA